MSKYVERGSEQKTVGAYLKVIKALNELDNLGEDVDFHAWAPRLTGIAGSIERDPQTGAWRFAQA